MLIHPILLGFVAKSLAKYRSLQRLSPPGKGQGNAVASPEQSRDPPRYPQVSPGAGTKTAKTRNPSGNGEMLRKPQAKWLEKIGKVMFKIV